MAAVRVVVAVAAVAKVENSPSTQHPSSAGCWRPGWREARRRCESSSKVPPHPLLNHSKAELSVDAMHCAAHALRSALPAAIEKRARSKFFALTHKLLPTIV